MIRIRLQAEEIKAFPTDCAGGHVKLVIPPAQSNVTGVTQLLSSISVRKQMRTYTIRNIDLTSGEIDVDFVAHGNTGPASAWALSAQVGDSISISSPGGPKLKNARSGKYVVAVDMTAFPAAAASVEKLPVDAQGDFYAEILSMDDEQPISAPPGIKMHWIVSDKDNDTDTFAQTVKTLNMQGNESIFVAGEYTTVANLKSYFRTERAYPKDQLYISSYWKKGLVESEHKRVKTLVA